MKFPLEAAYPHVWKGLNRRGGNPVGHKENLVYSGTDTRIGKDVTALIIQSGKQGITMDDLVYKTGYTRRQVGGVIHKDECIVNIGNRYKNGTYVYKEKK